MLTQKFFKIDEVPLGLYQAFMAKVAAGEKPDWAPQSNSMGDVVALHSDKFGHTEKMLVCKVDENGKPLEVLFSTCARENGAIDPVTGFGTPSVFFLPVMFDKNGSVLFGFTDEKRPAIRARYLLRPNNTYLDLTGNTVKYEKEPYDIVQVLPESKVKGDRWVDAEDHEVNRILYREGITVKGFSGGYGTPGVSDLMSIKNETAEEQGINQDAEIVMQSSMDRAWARVMDLYGFVIIPDPESIGAVKHGPDEMISKTADGKADITWVYPDKMDVRLTPDNHMLAAILATCFMLGLIGRKPKQTAWNEHLFEE